MNDEENMYAINVSMQTLNVSEGQVYEQLAKSGAVNFDKDKTCNILILYENIEHEVRRA